MPSVRLLVAAFAVLPLPALGQATAPSPSRVQATETNILGRDGQPIGTLFLRGGENATVARIVIRPGALSPGWHGLHFHAVGDCSDPGKYEHAKGHVNSDDAKHGLLHPEGPDEGDLPNVFANADGSVNAEVSSQSIALRAQDQEPALLDQDGSALIIHANEDDHASQPIGGSGDRVACAVIR